MAPLWAIFCVAAVVAGLAAFDRWLPSRDYCIGVSGRLVQAERLLETPGLSSQDYLHAEQWRKKLKAEHTRCYPEVETED